MMILAKNPVISVNGNVAALASKEIIELSKKLNAKIEINIFHSSKSREKEIQNEFIRLGADPLMPSKDCALKGLDHNRKYVSKEGIYSADVVFVPLEDGDRRLALKENGKKVITVDLNPMSRSATCADVTIVDNIVRCVTVMNERVTELGGKSDLNEIGENYDNKEILKAAREKIIENLNKD